MMSIVLSHHTFTLGLKYSSLFIYIYVIIYVIIYVCVYYVCVCCNVMCIIPCFIIDLSCILLTIPVAQSACHNSDSKSRTSHSKDHFLYQAPSMVTLII